MAGYNQHFAERFVGNLTQRSARNSQENRFSVSRAKSLTTLYDSCRDVGKRFLFCLLGTDEVSRRRQKEELSYLRVSGKRKNFPAVIICEAVDGELVLSLLDVVGLDERAEDGEACLLGQAQVVRVRVDTGDLDLLA